MIALVPHGTIAARPLVSFPCIGCQPAPRIPVGAHCHQARPRHYARSDAGRRFQEVDARQRPVACRKMPLMVSSDR